MQDLFASSPTVLIKIRPACFNAKDAEEGRFQRNYLSFKWPAGIYWLYIWCVAYLNFNHIIVIKGTTLCFILLTKCYVVIIVSFTGPVVASSNSNIALSNDTILYKNKRLFRLVCSGVNPSTQPWLHQTESFSLYFLFLCVLCQYDAGVDVTLGSCCMVAMVSGCLQQAHLFSTTAIPQTVVLHMWEYSSGLLICIHSGCFCLIIQFVWKCDKYANKEEFEKGPIHFPFGHTSAPRLLSLQFPPKLI